MIRPSDLPLIGLSHPVAARFGPPPPAAQPPHDPTSLPDEPAMSASFRTPYQRIQSRRRRSQTIAWLLFLAFIAAIFAARILLP
jgi:hypothetical protein